MRRTVLALLLAALTLLVAARAGDRPSPQALPAAVWDSGQYNVVRMDMPAPPETAGSSLAAGLDAYFMARRPTAKNDRTGQLAGQDLVVLLAEDWQADPGQTQGLWGQAARFPAFYAPDWYQGADGREFALLSGVTPTAVGGGTALAWVGEQGTSLPFALGNALGAAGYTCRLYPVRPERAAAYEALGFETGRRLATDGETIAAALPDLAAHRPFAACFVLSGTDGTETLEALWRQLDQLEMADTTAVCLAAGADAPLRGTLALWGGGLAGAEVTAPCSDLDVTPTLLNLLGAAYDARFLFGRDLFAAAEDSPVSLYGSAYSDWVTAAGSYMAAQEAFIPAAEAPGGEGTARYVQQMRQEVYDRYVCAQQAMESNYYRIALG